MGAHLIDNEFQSDKYPATPRGKVPLSCKDVTAQDLLWEYAQRRRSVDAEFSYDLEAALRIAGFVPESNTIFAALHDRIAIVEAERDEALAAVNAVRTLYGLPLQSFPSVSSTKK